MDDIAAEEASLPRLKAVRQTMRAVGNWAAGKYVGSESRIQLREKLLEYFRAIFGDHADPPSVKELDSLINEVDDPQNNPQQLILKMKSLFDERNTGVSKNVS